MAALAALLAGGATLWVMYRLLFGDRDSFSEAVRLWIGDLSSMFRRETNEEYWADIKLSIMFGCGSAAGYGVYNYLLVTP